MKVFLIKPNRPLKLPCPSQENRSILRKRGKYGEGELTYATDNLLLKQVTEITT